MRSNGSWENEYNTQNALKFVWNSFPDISLNYITFVYDV